MHLLSKNISVAFIDSPIESAMKYFNSNGKFNIWNKLTKTKINEKVTLLCVAIPIICFEKDKGDGKNIVFSLKGI